ncbi:DUF6230 family protein [Saccharothrix sp. ST-888]|uniref:DUF6230 family protein n=1 Tax=Saccharothrix sp. ST-888 TaxID=1427391 RepID=UPI0005EC308A|nr:DUF6230 family protein [Saccharothrix sp. ST-888]KJK55742.1 hypothetical protein UK12_26720 [Saccharothrix sp. ST-888]
MPRSSGRTRWKRFAVVLTPGIAATALLALGMAKGAFAASFFISNEQFKLSADSLTGEGLSLYGMIDVARDGTHVPVEVTGFRSARIDGLCQSVVVPIPVLGPFTLRLTSGDRGAPATAREFFIDTTLLKADDATIHNIDVGIAAGSLTTGEISPGDRSSPLFDPNGIALQGTTTTLRNLRSTAVAASAGTINLPGMVISLRAGRNECF